MSCLPVFKPVGKVFLTYYTNLSRYRTVLKVLQSLDLVFSKRSVDQLLSSGALCSFDNQTMARSYNKY